MDLLWTGFELLGGGIFLIVGAEALVRGASRMAARLGISPLVIGLTVVAYGTSAPEMAVSVMAGMSGKGAIALGNVLGSNIFNVLLILGISAMFVPLAVSQQLVRMDVPLMIGVSVLAFLLARDGVIGRVDGLVLTAGATFYTIVLIGLGRRAEVQKGPLPSADGSAAAGRPSGKQGLMNAVWVFAGLGLLVLGSRWFVSGAVVIARRWGLSEMITGLTIVAAGTSLPEAATSVMASLKGERDIAVGNVVGSNIFNLLAVLGLTGLTAPEGVPVSASALNFDFPIMMAVALACLPIFVSDLSISRWEGGLFLAYYAAYTTYLVLAATGHGFLRGFTAAMIWFVLPLTATTLIAIALPSVFRRNNRKSGENL